MAITTRDGLIAAMAAGKRCPFFKSSVSVGVAGRMASLFRVTGNVVGGAAPASTGLALDRTTQGALAIPAAATVTYFTGFESAQVGLNPLIVSDRLVEFGGLSGITTSAQSVSAVALPARATGALDVELWLEVYTSIGATPSATVTAQYTNQGGTASRTATLVGGIPATLVANSTMQFALQAGDTGVQSVQSVTSTASTGTAGNFGLVLRRCHVFGIPGGSSSTANGFTMGYAETALEKCPDAACVEILAVSTATTTGTIMGNVNVAQG